MSYLVSLVIPVYNVAPYIKDSLLSALGQTFESIEFIIVDDCSTDKSMGIVYEVLESHPRKNDVVIVHHKQNEGLSSARNSGLAEASGDYVFFLDSDDEILPDCIEKHFDAIRNTDAQFTVSNFRLVGGKSFHNVKVKNDVVNIVPLAAFFKRKYSVSAWNKLYRKDFLQKYNLYFQNSILYEDILWSYQVAALAKNIAFVDGAYYLYKLRKGSITRNSNIGKKVDNLLWVMNKIQTESSNFVLSSQLKSSRQYFFNYWQFNIALVLLNDPCQSYSEKGKCYQKIRALYPCFNFKNLYNLAIHLPFPLFVLGFSTIYHMYKKYS